MHSKIKHLIEQLESYNFECTGGSLENAQPWKDLKALLDTPATQVVKFQVANVSGLPGFGAYAFGSLRNDGSYQLDLTPGKGMVTLDVEAHFNDSVVEAEDGLAIPELCTTHRRDLLVETLMHEFGHVLQDYFQKELGCEAIESICEDYRRELQKTRKDTHDFPGAEALSQWFGLSYASYLVRPRVLMEAMDDPWKERMAALLNEMDEEFTNLPTVNFTVRVVDPTNGSRMMKAPVWLGNYRHPSKHLIDSFRKQEDPLA